MDLAPQYRPNAPAVIAEMIDGEAVIINLDTGAYFAISGSGADVWEAIEQGVRTADLATNLAARYPGDVAAMGEHGSFAADVTAFLVRLTEHALVVATDDTPPPAPTVVPRDGGAYEPPVLEVYTDMQELILLDPVHDVDAVEGWPRAAAPAE